MVQILEGKGPSFAQSIMGGLAQGIPDALQKIQAREQMKYENEQAKRYGIDLSGIHDPKLREKIMGSALQGQLADKKAETDFIRAMEVEKLRSASRERAAQIRASRPSGGGGGGGPSANELKQLEKLGSLTGAIDTLDRMKQLRKTGKLGFGSSYSPFPSTRQAAGEYSQLGKSLIQLSTSIPIRNRQEFETLAEGLYDPNITDAAANGTIRAMERIIKQNIETSVGVLGGGTGGGKASGSRPPISSFGKGKK